MSEAGPATATTVFVIDDHPVVREGLVMLLGASGVVSVVGSSATASAAIGPLAVVRPDVILLDLDLGSEDGLEWLPRLVAAAPATFVLVLTALREPSRDEAALRAGARGLVLKDASPDALLQAIRVVREGGLWFDPAVLDASLRASAASAAEGTRADQLTAREREIVALLGEGLKNEEVAGRLGISEKTVRNHLTAVYDKIGVKGRLELLVYAYRHGLVRAAR